MLLCLGSMHSHRAVHKAQPPSRGVVSMPVFISFVRISVLRLRPLHLIQYTFSGVIQRMHSPSVTAVHVPSKQRTQATGLHACARYMHVGRGHRHTQHSTARRCIYFSAIDKSVTPTLHLSNPCDVCVHAGMLPECRTPAGIQTGYAAVLLPGESPVH